MSERETYAIIIENAKGESIEGYAFARIDFSYYLRLDIDNTEKNRNFIRQNSLFFVKPTPTDISHVTIIPWKECQSTWVKLLKKTKKCNRAEKTKYAYITFICRELSNLEVMREASK